MKISPCSKLSFLLRDKLLIIILIAFVVSFLLKALSVFNYNFPFTMDQARDMLDIRNIVIGKHFTLIGPTTSINGVFLGPFYYYFNVPAFILWQGDPSGLIFWQILWYQLAGIITWISLKKYNARLAFITSIMLFFSPPFFNMNRYSWNANTAPIFVIFFFLILFSILNKPTITKMLLLGLMSGLTLQTEAAFGILLFPFSVLILIFRKTNWKYLLMLGGSFFLTLFPQILFELRHNFLMTGVFIREFSSQTVMLGDRLTLPQTISSHFLGFMNVSKDLLPLPNNFSSYLLLIAIIFLLFKARSLYFLTTLAFIIFAYLFYLLYPHPLKSWYINGLYVPYLLILAIFFHQLLQKRNRYLFYSISFIILFFVAISAHSQFQTIPKNISIKSDDRSNLRNEVEAIDWVYQKAQGKGFKAFNYIPSVYDYPYQYLFWWYGTRKYDYQPDKVAYLENVPEYVVNNTSYWKRKKTVEGDSLTFLLMEKDYDHPERLQAWLGNFHKLCILEKKVFPWKTEIWVGKPCSTK